ncbi:alkaline phytoceramidase-like protein [Xylariaceae sp. FL1272]|nr:alkaline phytoceramidase-like protein [Xylariaceae sp. FL1272]
MFSTLCLYFTLICSRAFPIPFAWYSSLRAGVVSSRFISERRRRFRVPKSTGIYPLLPQRPLLSVQMATFSFPYHQPRDGFWGDKTSTLNFCEEDYVMSYYCAEVCNTVTNALFLWFGYRGIRDCLRYAHPTIFFVTFVGYIIVGVGSTLFHATLKYPMQLLDELAMIYTTCFMVHATFAYKRSFGFSCALGLALMGLAWYITARYYQTKDPQFHQDAYALLTAMVVFSNMWIMEKSVRPALKLREGTRSKESPVPTTQAIMVQMWIMVATGLSVFLGGFLVWNLDNIFCNTIRSWRHHLELPWAVVFEGHAWWHLSE